jgi:GT2 family glycosyltransferase
VAWELLLVDNGSTDATAEIARTCWRGGPAPLRIIHEPHVGLRYARELGLAEASYPFVGFVDDDNWVEEDWVCTAYHVLSSDPNLGAVGGIRNPASEIPLPDWFGDYHSAYAVLTDRELDEMRTPAVYLAGAGLCIRKAAWEWLVQGGYQFQLTGRKGKKLQGGEDAELTMALRLSGWKIRIDQRLRLQHFMPSQRLQWMYLRRLLRNYGVSHVLLDAYSEHSLSLTPGFRQWLSDRWWYQLGKALTAMARRPDLVAVAVLSRGEGWKSIIEMEKQVGRAIGLLQASKGYAELRRKIRSAPWRRPHHSSFSLDANSKHVEIHPNRNEA